MNLTTSNDDARPKLATDPTRSVVERDALLATGPALLAVLIGAPYAAISVGVDDTRHVSGTEPMPAFEQARHQQLSNAVIAHSPDPLVIDATHDDARRAYPAAGPISFAGTAIVGPTGNSVGAVYVIDKQQRCFEDGHVEALRLFAEHMAVLLELYDTNESLRARADHWEQLSTIDELTGIWNRRGGTAAIERAIAQHARNEHASAVIVADIDGLKDINDRYGHATGDLLLRTVATRLTHAVRSSDLVCRFGGDEFVILGSAPQTRDGLGQLVVHLKRAVERRVEIGTDIVLEPTLSLGSTLTQPNDMPGAAFARADRAMYDEKLDRS